MEHSDVKRNYKKDDIVIDVHIPAVGPLLKDECIKSLDYAKEFFTRCFPDYKWEIFTCHSWLLGEELRELLDEGSNIIKFQKLFTIASQCESDAILGYTFRWKIKREELLCIEPNSSFAKKVKKMALNGGIFHEGIGYINKGNI